MKKYELKKIIPVFQDESIESCEKLICSENFCLGIFNEHMCILGFATNEDILKALNHNIGQMPISLITTLAEFKDLDICNLEEQAFNDQLKNGLNQGLLVGASRKEITHIILSSASAEKNEQKFIQEKYENILPEAVKKALAICYLVADKNNLPLFLIGGVVRDIILGRQSQDIDITVQGNAIEYCGLLEKEFPEICTVQEIHEAFKTAKISFKLNGEKLILDIASTRTEIYEKPASLPLITKIGCDICQDIARRDFTINSMALSLNKETFCFLIDPLKGYEDLKNSLISVIHPLSFIDDPTRIVRALKFSVRFDCKLDAATKYLQTECIKSGLFNNICSERLKSEIKQSFNLNKKEFFDRFVNEKIYLLVDEEIATNALLLAEGQIIEKTVLKQSNNLINQDFIWLIYFSCLLNFLSKDKIVELSSKLNLSRLESNILLDFYRLVENKEKMFFAETNFEIYEFFANCSSEAIVAAIIVVNNCIFSDNAVKYFTELQQIKITTTGKTLIEAGFSQGSALGKMLREIKKAKINGLILTEEDEKAFVKQMVSKNFN